MESATIQYIVGGLVSALGTVFAYLIVKEQNRNNKRLLALEADAKKCHEERAECIEDRTAARLLLAEEWPSDANEGEPVHEKLMKLRKALKESGRSLTIAEVAYAFRSMRGRRPS